MLRPLMLTLLALSLFTGCQTAEFSPYSSEELDAMGRRQARKGNHQEAITYFDTAIRTDPDNVFALYNIALSYRALKQLDKEKAYLLKLMDSDLFTGAIPDEDNPEVEAKRVKTNAYQPSLRDMVLGGWMRNSGEREKIIQLKPDLKRGRDIYFAKCSNKCHEPEAWGTKDGKYPMMAGQHYRVTIKQMADIREKNRDTPTMYKYALPSEIGGEQAVADVAAYIEKIPMTLETGKGPGTNLERGKEIYERYCKYCHGDEGEGHQWRYYPRIQGQHYEYLVRQIDWMKQGKRQNVHPFKMIQVKRVPREDLLLALDYVSRLEPFFTLVAEPGWRNPDADKVKDPAEEQLQGEGLF